jgi:RNA polymerase sigma-70 factor (ECF subfamily)
MEVTANDTPDINGIIDQSLLLLSEMQKSVLLLKDYEGYQYNEIADILEISGDSVKVHLFRARKKIKEHLKDLRLVI